MAFLNDNSKTNGEQLFFSKIKDKINVIFDVGSRDDTEFIEFEGEVHYFDPVKEFILRLSQKENKNKISYFNSFGLGEETKELFYYPKHQSFYDRLHSIKVSDEENKVLLKIKKAKDYILEKKIKSIDFLKIDTEGYEFNVLKGFEEFLENVAIIQFEYGGCYIDSNVKLNDVIEYLKEKGFIGFSYLIPTGTKPITNYLDHYHYCNIVCFNKNKPLIVK